MKKNILLLMGGLFVIGGSLNAQCSLTGLNQVYCDGDAASTLVPSGSGTISGNGIVGNDFDPGMAGVGMHQIIYAETTTATYTVDQTGTFAPVNSAGTAVSLNDDQVSGILPIGFNFEFFGTVYTDFYISSNGFISFDAGVSQGCCSGGTFPSADAVNNVIAWSWNDLYPPGGGTITYETIGAAPNRQLLVTFTDQWHCCSGPAVNTGQIVLSETSNVIEIHNTEITTDGSSCTQGIENAAGNLAYFVGGRNSATWTANNDYVAFYPDTVCADIQMVEVAALPAVTGSIDVNTICEGDMVTLTGGGADSAYVWDNSAVDGTPIAPAGTMMYTVIGYDSTGCSNSATVNVTVNPAPATTFVTSDEVAGTDGTITVTTTGGTAPYTYDWDMDGTGDFDDAADQTGLAGGTYTVVIMDANGCTYTEAITIDSQVSIDEIEGLEFSIFPNPSTGVFQITLATENLDNLTYEVVNALGQVITSEKISSNVVDVDVSGNESGIYYVKIISEKGTSVKSIILK